jgi:hypothetical protein
MHRSADAPTGGTLTGADVLPTSTKRDTGARRECSSRPAWLITRPQGDAPGWLCLLRRLFPRDSFLLLDDYAGRQMLDDVAPMFTGVVVFHGAHRDVAARAVVELDDYPRDVRSGETFAVWAARTDRIR